MKPKNHAFSTHTTLFEKCSARNILSSPGSIGCATVAAYLLLLFLANTSTAAAPEFIAVAADGSRGQGPIVELNEKGDLTLEGEKPFHVKSGELIELRRIGGSVPKPPS